MVGAALDGPGGGYDTLAQGYLFAGPMAAADVIGALQTQEMALAGRS